MEITHRQVVEYWEIRESECGLSVDWAEAEKLCWRCASARILQRCHITPRALGGSDGPSNLVLLCAQCHAEAPNVEDPTFMWTWLRAHAAPFYGTYWYERGVREYEFIFGRKPLEDISYTEAMESRLRGVIAEHILRTSTHWGQGRLNAATVAWLLHQVEQKARNDS